MSFGAFFVKRVVMPFFVITTCIGIAEGLIGMIFYSDKPLSPDALFSPAILGAMTALTSLVHYSKHELSMREILIRKAIHLAIIEGIVLGLNYIAGNLTDIIVTVSIAVAVFIIFVTVYLVQYLSQRRISDELTAALHALHDKNGN